jgi:hypothetical protein
MNRHQICLLQEELWMDGYLGMEPKEMSGSARGFPLLDEIILA